MKQMILETFNDRIFRVVGHLSRILLNKGNYVKD